ncbi:MAG TPA: glycosyltransferase family A protein [Vicinamibacteria bacterium]
MLASLICRTYAVLPCVVTVLLAGACTAIDHGVAAAAALTAIPLGTMWTLFPGFRTARAAASAAVYFASLAAPAALIDTRGAAGFTLGVLAEAALNLLLLGLLPRLGGLSRFVQPELFPDILTGFVLVLVVGLPVRFARARYPPVPLPRPPYDVAILVCSFEEDRTIGRCLESIRRNVDDARARAAVRSVRVVLVDSDSRDDTRALAASRVDRIVDGHAGKLTARHRATLAEECDLVVAADGDRAYGDGWLTGLLAPFGADPAVVATMGETTNEGSGLSGSALARRLLKIPFNAGNSAYFKAAYLRIPFDLAVDQFKHRAIWPEEEFLFSLRMQALGKIVHVPESCSFELRPYSLLAQVRRHLFGARLRTF